MPTLDNIVLTVATCQIPLFFVGISLLFNSLAMPLNEILLDLSCLMILITSCSSRFFSSLPFLLFYPKGICPWVMSLFLKPLSCMPNLLKHSITVERFTFIRPAISLIGRSRLTYRLDTYDLLRNGIFESNCIVSRISGVSSLASSWSYRSVQNLGFLLC